MIRSCLAITVLLFLSCSSLFEPSSGLNDDNNGSIAQAETITLGVQRIFTLPTRLDDDFYKITLTKDGLIRMKCSHIPSNMEIYMELEDVEGTILASAITSQGLDDSLYYSADVGSYYLKIQDLYHRDSSASSMNLMVVLDSVDTFETNNIQANAKYIDFDNSYYSKTMPLSDVDYFTFSLSQPNIVILNIDSVSSRLQLYVELQNSEGVLVTSITAPDAGSPIVLPKSLLAGNYYYKFKSNYDRNYSDKPFVFKLTKYNKDTCEWNDSSANAKAINGVMAGTIYPLGDIDFYSFSRSDSGTTIVTVDSVSSLIDIYIELLNTEKVLITSQTGYIGSKVILSQGLRAGNYYLRIKDLFSNACAEKTYYLTMQNN